MRDEMMYSPMVAAIETTMSRNILLVNKSEKVMLRSSLFATCCTPLAARKNAEN